MKTMLERDRAMEILFIYLGLAETRREGEESVTRYLFRDNKFFSNKKSRQELSFYFSCSREENRLAIERVLKNYFPESSVIEDLDEFKKQEYRRYAILDIHESYFPISRIRDTFEALDNSGILVAIAPRRMIIDNRRFRWGFLGLHGFWAELTDSRQKTEEEALIVLRRQDAATIAKKNKPSNGYPSFYVDRIMREVAIARNFWSMFTTVKNGYFGAKKEHPSIVFEREAFAQELSKYLDDFIDNQGVYMHQPMYYTPEIRKQVLDELYDEFMEEIEDELEE